MARSRNIKPGFFKNELLASLDPYARLLFIGLWTYADKSGRFEVRLEKIKGEIFPYEQIMLDSCMADLWDKQFLTFYESGGKHFAQVNNWHRHQSPHHKEVNSEIPECESEKVFENIKEIQTWLKHSSSMNHSRLKKNASSPLIPDSGFLIPDSLQSDSVEPEARPPDIVTSETDFEILWKKFTGEFGNKGSKAGALTEFKKLKFTYDEFQKVLEAADMQHANKRQQSAAGKDFIEPFQHVERWLKKRRFEDEIIPVTATGCASSGRHQLSKSGRTRAAVADYIANG